MDITASTSGAISYLGGLVGVSYAQIYNSISSGTINYKFICDAQDKAFVGGISGAQCARHQDNVFSGLLTKNISSSDVTEKVMFAVLHSDYDILQNVTEFYVLLYSNSSQPTSDEVELDKEQIIELGLNYFFNLIDSDGELLPQILVYLGDNQLRIVASSTVEAKFRSIDSERVVGMLFTQAYTLISINNVIYQD